MLTMMLTIGGRGDVDAALVLMDFVPTDNISSPSQTPQSLLLKQVISAKQVQIYLMINTRYLQSYMHGLSNSFKYTLMSYAFEKLIRGLKCVAQLHVLKYPFA